LEEDTDADWFFSLQCKYGFEFFFHGQLTHFFIPLRQQSLKLGFFVIDSSNLISFKMEMLKVTHLNSLLFFFVCILDFGEKIAAICSWNWFSKTRWQFGRGIICSRLSPKYFTSFWMGKQIPNCCSFQHHALPGSPETKRIRLLKSAEVWGGSSWTQSALNCIR